MEWQCVVEQRLVKQRLVHGHLELMTMTKSIAHLPASVRVLLAGVVTAGAAAVAIRLPQLGSWTARDLVAFVLLVGATFAGEQLRVTRRFGEQTKNGTMTETP